MVWELLLSVSDGPLFSWKRLVLQRSRAPCSWQEAHKIQHSILGIQQLSQGRMASPTYQTLTGSIRSCSHTLVNRLSWSSLYYLLQSSWSSNHWSDCQLQHHCYLSWYQRHHQGRFRRLADPENQICFQSYLKTCWMSESDFTGSVPSR